MAKKKSEQNVIVSGKGPIFSLALGICFSAAIAYNALGRQDARHPAPFEGFWNLGNALDEKSPPHLLRRDSKAPAIAAKRDPLIVELQTALTDLGYYDGIVDGLNGPQTRTAIIKYEKKHQLGGRGQPTSGLLDHIKLNQRILDAVNQTSSVPQSDAKKKVRLVQLGLSELGYTPGPIDGRLGEQTVQAIKSFELDRRLKVTGRVTNALIHELHKTTGLSSLNIKSGNT